MAELKDMLPAGYTEFSENADFIWNCILHSSRKNSVDQEKFMRALAQCIGYLNSLKIDEVKFICVEGDMAEKISIIVDLKDYAYEALLRDWNQGS